jgi:archaellum biogenesis protein FlaJ (TadC family)
MRESVRQREEDTMKTLAFVVALLILVIGAVGTLVPSSLVWIAQYSATSAAFYVIGAVRVALGLVLISVASASRAPKALSVLGFFILIAGIATALMGLVAMDRARSIVDWWLHQGPGVIRLAGVLVLAIGGFLAYALAPARRAA